MSTVRDSQTYQGSGSTMTIDKDLLTSQSGDGIMVVAHGYGTITAPSGSGVTFTEKLNTSRVGEFGNTNRTVIWTGIRGATFNDFTIGNGAADTWHVVLIAVTNPDAAFVDGTPLITASSFGTIPSPVAPSITDLTTSNALLLTGVYMWPSLDANYVFTHPSGMTTDETFENWDAGAVSSLVLSSSAATGTKTYSETPANISGACTWIAWSLAVKAGSTGTPVGKDLDLRWSVETYPRFDQIVTNTSTANRSATGSISHTVTAGRTNVIVLAFIASRGDETISGGTPPTYGGTAMTLLGSIGNSVTNADPKIWVYGILRGNTTGANNCVVTYGATVNPDWVAVVGYSDCTQTLPPSGDVFTNTGTSNSPSVAGTSLDTGARYVGAYTGIGGDVDPSTPVSGAERADITTGTSTTADDGGAVGDLLASAGSATYSATMAVSDKWAAIGVELRRVVSLTAIGKDLDIRWLLRAAVGDPTDLRWITRAALGDPLSLRWAIRTPIGDPADLRWGIRTPVGDPVDLRWITRAALGDPLSLRWLVRAPIGDPLDVRWGIRTPVGDPTDLRWGVRSRLGDTVDARWSVRAPLGDPIDLRWIVRARIGDSADLRWAIRTPVGDTLDLRWAIRTAVGDPLALVWNVLASTGVGKGLDLRWGIRTPAGDPLDLRWAIRSAVGDPASLQWRVRAVSGDNLDARWVTRARVGDPLDLRWVTRARIGDSLDARWAVRTATGDPLTLRWLVRAAAGDPLDLRWPVRARIGDPTDLRWAIRSTLGDPLDARWAVRSVLGDSADLRWRVRQVVGDNADLRWAVSGLGVGKALDLRWRIRAALGDPLAIVWHTRQAIADTADVRWGVRNPVGDTLDARWAIRTGVGDEIALAWTLRSSTGVEVVLLWTVDGGDPEEDRARLWRLNQIAIRIRRREVVRTMAAVDDNGLNARTLPRVVEDPPDPLDDPVIPRPWLNGDPAAYKALLERTKARKRDTL